MGMTWTKDQQKVIDMRGKDILVSAAAGSGKTAVLVERIIERVTDEKNPIDIDRLLVVTFTKAAAAEMRERIGAAIDAAREKNPKDPHLLRQTVLVHNAKITTIDSFCLFVVRNHFDEIGLDPDFRIADEGEVKLLEMDVLDSVFEENYSDEDNEKFLRLIDCYATKRNDASVKDMVRRIYNMSLSNPWPREWIAGLAEPYQNGQGGAPMADLIDNVRLLISDMADEMKNLAQIAAQPDGPKAYASTISEEADALYEIASCSDFDKLREHFKNPPFKRLAAIRAFKGDAVKKDMVSERRNAIKKEFQDIGKKYFNMSLEEVKEQQERLLPVAEELVRLALSYSEAMAAQKRKKRIVDFSDIEHFALEILVDSETKKSRRTAEEFRRHFDEIMIDEYQDSNQVQEVIMRAISKNEEQGHNIFMVGDVKQSIYRFRLARPELFMEKYATFDTGDGSDEIRIDLSQNFRSREEVTDYCNDIFYKIMAKDLGSVSYDDDAALHCGAKYPSCTCTEPELLLLDMADERLGEHGDLSKAQLEAHMAGWRIKKLMAEGQVTDKESGELRPVRYSDIVILMRSLRDSGPVFSDTLASLGIPSHVDSSTGYFSATEVQTVLNMLRILDNPYQDIPMAAVLRSPMAGLSDEELAEIRVENQGGAFSAAAIKAMREAEEESGLKKFYDIYQRLRAMRDIPVHELIQKILDETGYGNYAAALPAGKQRSANLSMLIEKAVDYEKTSYRGLFHFVRYIDQMKKYDIDFGEADVSGENADTVRIMTIHHSKGLEFPVVFVCGLGKSINQRETAEHLLLHADLGMGLCEISGRPKIKRHSLSEAQIAERIRRENLGEELRVLYVALTRAKEKLILCGTVKDLGKAKEKCTGNVISGKPISYRQRANATSYLDWIIPALLSYPEKYDISAVDPAQLVWDEVRLEGEKNIEYSKLIENIKNADTDLEKKYGEMFSYEYPYKNEAGRKSKYSVSELKHESMLRKFDQNENEAALPKFLQQEKEPYIPSFAAMREMPTMKKMAEKDKENIAEKNTGETKKLPGKTAGLAAMRGGRGALAGTAFHRIMLGLDFAKLSKISGEKELGIFVRDEIERIKTSGKIPEEIAGFVVPSGIERFAASPLAQRMAGADAAGNLYREKPFVMQRGDILVQGIIDAFWIEDGEIVLLDYKTDNVRTVGELVKRYKMQLDLYADALSRLFSTEEKSVIVKEKLIYSSHLLEVISI